LALPDRDRDSYSRAAFQTQLELLLPVGIGQRQHTAARSGGTAGAVDQNVESAEPVESCTNDMIGSRARTDICLNQMFGIAVGRDGFGGGENRGSAAQKTCYNGFANPFGPAGDENSLSGEFVRIEWMLGDCVLTRKSSARDAYGSAGEA
jgi:hypothetical protein